VQGYGDDRAVEEWGERAQDEDAGEFADGGVETGGGGRHGSPFGDDASLNRTISWTG
jgi:hypothetical protein